MNEIILIGDGGHCKSVIDVIEQEGQFKVAGVVGSSDKVGKEVLGYKVLGDDSNLEELSKNYSYALVTLGQIFTSDKRINLYSQLTKYGFILPKVISPRAYVSKYSVIGSGTVVMHDAVVNANAIVGDNCIINSKALIEHDSTINHHCHISTNAIINGNVLIGEGSFIGSGAVVCNSLTIKKNSFIKAGVIVK
jgi:sugar O-acyltransferase (sialic acid O-acetyltransferase NeuD family)